jgi:hypothetical protein
MWVDGLSIYLHYPLTGRHECMYAYLQCRRRSWDGFMPPSTSPNPKQHSETFSSGMRLCSLPHVYDFFEDPTDFIIKADNTASLYTLICAAIWFCWRLPLFRSTLLSPSSRLVNSFTLKILKVFTILDVATSQETFVFIDTAVRT